MDAFRPHQMTLTPHQPVRFKDCRSIAYMTGDLPSVILHIGGDKYELFPGQCIPTGGTIVMIENPYERHGLCEFTLNGPPQPMADMRALPGSRQSKYVTYHRQVVNTAPAADTDKGTLIHMKTGRGLVRLSGGPIRLARVWPGVPAEALDDYRPDGVFNGAVPAAAHTGGADLQKERLEVRKGSVGDSALWDAWLAPYGLNWAAGRALAADTSGNLEVDLDGPSLMIAYDSVLAGVVPDLTAVSVEDYGVREGVAHA